MAGDLDTILSGRLRAGGHRYTTSRRALVATLGRAARPLTVQEILDEATALAQSSVYRNLALLEEAGAVVRVVTADDFVRYELAPDLTGHHHHLICSTCGSISDVILPNGFEVELASTLEQVSRRASFRPSDHRLDVLGTCVDCA